MLGLLVQELVLDRLLLRSVEPLVPLSLLEEYRVVVVWLEDQAVVRLAALLEADLEVVLLEVVLQQPVALHHQLVAVVAVAAVVPRQLSECFPNPLLSL